MLLSKALMMGGGSGPEHWIALLEVSDSAGSGYSVATDSADNIVTFGRFENTETSARQSLTIKYDKAGVVQWAKTLGSGGIDQGRSMAIDSADNIIVCGNTDTTSGGNAFFIAKYNSSGTLQWQKTLYGSTTEGANAVTIDSADNIIVCGYTDSEGAGSSDLLIAKYNSAGTLQWQKILGGTGADIGWGVTTDSADNIIVCGYTLSDGAGDVDLLVAKYDSAGALQWDRTLGGTGDDRGYSVTTDSADNIVVCGYTDSDGAGGDDFLLAKYDSAGTLQWDRTLGGTEHDYGRSVITDSADNIIMFGYTRSDGAGSYDVLIAKYNSAGTLQWQKTLGGTTNDVGYSVAMDSADNLLICGGTYPSFLTARLPPDGAGNGTYGPYTYQDSALIDAAAVLTDAAAVLTDATSTLTDDTATLTSSDAVYTETLYEVS